MFFAGFAVIMLLWFVGSLIRGKGFKQFSYAELLAGFFALFIVTFVIGLAANPAAPGVWGGTLLGYVFIGLAVSLLISIGMPTKRDDTTSAARGMRAAVQESYAKRYEAMFVAFTVVTMLLALLMRFIHR